MPINKFINSTFFMRYWTVILKFIWWSVNVFWRLYLASSIYAVYAKIEKYIFDLFLLDYRQYHIFSGESQWISSKWIQLSPCVCIHPSCQGDAAILKILKFYYLDYPWFCSVYKNFDLSCLEWHFQALCIVSCGILMLCLFLIQTCLFLIQTDFCLPVLSSAIMLLCCSNRCFWFLI